MAMTPGNQAITGGTVLRAPAIQSPNFLTGVSGWIIRQDGTVEFTAGTFRGSISVGTSPGQRFIVNNPVTGDVIDVYDSANNLIFAITNQGQAISYSTGSTPQPSVNLQGAKVVFSDNATPTAHTAQISFQHNSAPAGQGQITLLNSDNASAVGALEILSGSTDGTKGPTVQAIERTRQGSVVVSDNISVNNLMHAASYSGTTNAGGHLVFNHNCGFTPTVAVVTGTTPGGTFANLTCGLNSLTATQADVSWIVANTNAAFANQGITFDMVFFG